MSCARGLWRRCGRDAAAEAGGGGAGGVAVIALSMLRVDHFWIANAMFLSGLLAAFYAAILKIRAYQRGL